MFLSALSATSFYHDPYIGRGGSGRARCLAIDDVVVYMRYHYLGYYLAPCTERLFDVVGRLRLVMDKEWKAVRRLSQHMDR